MNLLSGPVGEVNWTQVAQASQAISSVVQSGASAYTSIAQATQKPYSQAVQQFLQQGPPSSNNDPKSDNTMYFIVGGFGLLALAGTAIVLATPKKKNNKGA
jgi:hypothetical protein